MIRISVRAYLAVLLASTLALSCSKSSPTKPQPPQLGDVGVLSIPTGAAILLDGASTAKATPDTLRDIAAGSHVIGLRLANYADTAVTVSIPSGALARV